MSVYCTHTWFDVVIFFFFFKQKTAYEIYQCDWSSDVCSSDLQESTVVNVPGPYPATIKDAKNKVEVGKQYTYTITIESTGSADIGHLWVNDTLPYNLSYVSDTAAASPNFVSSTINSPDLYYEFSTLPVGDIITFDIVTFVGVMNASTITNTINVDYDDISGNMMPQVNASHNTIIERPIITVTKIVDKSSALPGDFLNYTIYFNNTGQKNADTVWINDTLPAGVTYISDTAAGLGTYVASDTTGNPLLYEFAKVKKNTYNAFTITVQVNATPPPILTNWVNLDYERRGLILESSSDSAIVIIPEFRLGPMSGIIVMVGIFFVSRRKIKISNRV